MNNIESIWKDYHSALLGFIRSRVNEADVADDILQDVFIRVHTKIDSLKDSKRLKPWIYQITRNAIIDYYRTRKPHVELPESLVAPEQGDTEVIRQELETCIMPLIKDLPEHYRTAMILSEIDGLSQKAVAEKLDMSLSGAKSRIQRGRNMLKDTLNKCCVFEIDHQGTVVDYQTKTKAHKNCCK